MPSIYILDYDPDITYVLCEWFNQNGFLAIGFSKPLELFNQTKESPPDCIILDSFYGEQLITTEICNTIRHVLNYKGIILLTSTSSISETYLHACDSIGYIAKPFNLADLLD